MPKVVHRNRMFKIEEISVSRRGKRYKLFKIEYNTPVIVILPLVSSGVLLMERQYRGVIGRYLYEVPAGYAHKHEALSHCARRELEEETGYKAGRLVHLLSDYPAPGTTNQIRHYFIATNLKRGKRSLDKDEDIDVKRMKISTAMRLIKSRKIVDSKTITAILFYSMLKRKG